MVNDSPFMLAVRQMFLSPSYNIKRHSHRDSRTTTQAQAPGGFLPPYPYININNPNHAAPWK
jgi:hypothetical protein